MRDRLFSAVLLFDNMNCRLALANRSRITNIPALAEQFFWAEAQDFFDSYPSAKADGN
jgi:hypothetical protein